MSARKYRLIFAGGGTGGHLFPAIAMANRVKELLAPRGEVEILFVGTRNGIEYRLRDSLGYPLELIHIRGLVRSLTPRNLALPFVVVWALFRSAVLLRRFRPDVVVGSGGYVSWPVLRMAASRKIPTVVQEQNSFPGVATRQAAPHARKVFLGFAGAKKLLRTGAEIVVSGNPVRAELARGDRALAMTEFGLDPSKKTILILGGSQGARAINQAILKSLKESGLPEGFQLLWQTGKRDYKDVTASAGDTVSGCSLFPFSKNMELVYAAADLAVARAGALTLAELAACGIPTTLIPYPHAAGDHQRKNAEESEALGVATVIDETELARRDLLREAIDLMSSERYETMRAALERASAGRKPAVDIIAEGIVELIDAPGRTDATVDNIDRSR